MLKSVVSSWPRDALHGVVVGTLCGLLAIVQSIGFGTLLGSETSSLSLLAIGMTLCSTAVVAAVTPFLSSTPGVVSIAQGVPAVAIAGIIGPVAIAMTGAPDRTVLATIVVTVGLCSLFIGATSLVLGAFRLGRFVRFVPFPVVGGFLAGSGWLILRGGLEVVAGPTVANPAVLVDGPTLLKIAVAGAFLAGLAFFTALSRNRLVLPATVAAALVLFNVAVWSSGTPTTALRAGGWLLSLPTQSGLWPPIGLVDIGLSDWRAILAIAFNVPSVAILSVIALLMNATGIELDARRDIDLDRELTAVGVANLIAGAGGGPPGYHSVSLTLLASRLGARGVFVGATVAVVCLGGLIFGETVLSAVPTPLLGATLIWIGGALIAEWLFRSYSRLPVWEYLVIILIFIVIALFGFAWGILVGLAAAVAVFAVEYGRVDIVRLLVTGKDFHSSIDTSEERRQTLVVHGDAILIIRLQGFLFFGTADRLRQRIEERVVAVGNSPTRFVVVDFRRVTGLDSSTVLSFIRLSQIATRESVVVVFTGVSDSARLAMLRGGLELGDDSPIRFVADFDAGIKWCEDAVLSRAAPELAGAHTRPLTSRLSDILDGDEFAAKVAAYCERVDVVAGETLIEQGTPSDDIFFIESGHAAVAINSDRSTPIRLATIGPGAIIGEVAFYLSEPRSASVVAEEAMLVWRFSRESILRLQAELPDVGLRFHQGIAAMLAKRLMRTNHLVQLLAD